MPLATLVIWRWLLAEPTDTVVLQSNSRTYWCHQEGDELVVRNADGHERRLSVALASGAGVPTGEGSNEHPYVINLMREAAVALGLAA